MCDERGVRGARLVVARVLANLSDEAYEDIGRGVRSVARGYRDAFELRSVSRNRNERPRDSLSRRSGSEEQAMVLAK